MTKRYFLDRNGVATGRLAGKPGQTHIDIARTVLAGGEFVPLAGDLYDQMFAHGFARVREDAENVWVEHVKPLTRAQKRYLEDKQFQDEKRVHVNDQAFVESKEKQKMTMLKESKNWVLPNGKVQPVAGHSLWLVSNPKVAEQFGVDVAGLTPQNDDQEIRLRALKAGFVRLNYAVNGGTLTIEVCRKYWNRKMKEAVFNFVDDHVDQIDNIVVNVLSDDGARVVAHGSAQLFQYDGREKLEHLPLMSEGLRRSVERGDAVCERVREYFEHLSG